MGGGLVAVAVNSIDFGGSVRKLEVELDLVALVRIDGAEIDGGRRRRAGWLRDGRARQR